MKTNWPIYTVEYTQEKKKLPWAAAWMYWEIITLRYETKDKHPKIVLKAGSQKFMQMKQFANRNRLRVKKKQLMIIFLKRCRRDTLRGIKMLTLLRIKQVI